MFQSRKGFEGLGAEKNDAPIPSSLARETREETILRLAEGMSRDEVYALAWKLLERLPETSTR